MRFYEDGERTSLYKTEFSGNNRTGWLANGISVPEEGVEAVAGETLSLTYTPDNADFNSNQLYYLVIDAYDGSNFILASNSYTFQATDTNSLIYCGPYMDVPVVKNFGLMFELLNNELVTLNLR